jgi:hypothetical protein
MPHISATLPRMKTASRSLEDIRAEVKTLEALLDLVQPRSKFGDCNLTAIRVQIRVLATRMTPADLDRQWPDSEDEAKVYLRDNAQDAMNWLELMEDEPPSAGWQCLVKQEPCVALSA